MTNSTACDEVFYTLAEGIQSLTVFKYDEDGDVYSYVLTEYDDGTSALDLSINDVSMYEERPVTSVIKSPELGVIITGPGLSVTLRPYDED